MKRPIFLSASVPNEPPYMDRFDPLAIREAVIALVVVSLRERPLVFGGHPAISPLVEHAARSLGATKHVHIYQSRFFETDIPEVASKFENFHWTPKGADKTTSLEIMRKEMLASWDFCAAAFVGGMDGIFDEAKLFSQFFQSKPRIILGSTGGAAAMLLSETRHQFDESTFALMQNETRYRKVFRKLIPSS